MAYYRVKNGGTATGDAGRSATVGSGSFATLGTANYYNNIELAIAATTSPVASDIIQVSDLHSFVSGGNVSLVGVASNPFFIVAVDDANIENSRVSGFAFEQSSGSGDVICTNTFISGLSFRAGDDLVYIGNNLIQDFTSTVVGSGDVALKVTTDGSSLTAINGTVNLDSVASVAAVVSGGCSLTIENVTLQTTQASVTNFSSGGFIQGGGSIHARSCDFSIISGTLISDIGSSQSSDDTIDILLDRCKLAAGVADTNETFKSYNQRMVLSQCSDSDVAMEYSYRVVAFGGGTDNSGGAGLEDDSAIFRNEDEAFPVSGQKISYKIVTNSDASLGSPFWFDFPAVKGVKLTQSDNKKIALSITSDIVLTDMDVYIVVNYPDSTNYTTTNQLSTAPLTVGGTLDLMATPTTLTLDTTSTFTGGLTFNYLLEVDTASLGGEDSAPSIRVYVTKPSSTFNITSEPQVS